MRLFLDRMAPLQASETVRSPHRAPAGIPALDLQGQLMVFYRIRMMERSGRFEKRCAHQEKRYQEAEELSAH
jgi:hypothetical protein